MLDPKLEALQTLREEEQTARRALEQGYRDDLAAIGRLMTAPLRKARSELEEHLLSLGTLDPILSANLTKQQAELVALNCGRDAFVSASVRFRARFGIYAEELAAAEKRFLETVKTGVDKPGVPRREPRKITLPSIELDDERSIVPRSHASVSTVDRWIDELEMLLRAALECTLYRAYRMVLNRGFVSLARTRIAEHLASREPPAHVLGMPASASPKIRS
jgi:hypothetical protein